MAVNLTTADKTLGNLGLGDEGGLEREGNGTWVF